MMDKYKEEMSNVHAPMDLIMKTKAAVKEEEIKYQEELANANSNISNKEKDTFNDSNVQVEETDKRVVEFKPRASKFKVAIGVLAAAAVLLIVVLAGGLGRTDKGEQVDKLASGKESTEGTEISGHDKPFDVVELNDANSIPLEFDNVEELSEGDMLYRYITLDEGGAKVFVKQNEKAYIFTFKSSNISLILSAITDYLAE